MRRLVLFSLFFCILIPWTTANAQIGKITPELQKTLQSSHPEEEVSVIITLSDKADIRPFKGMPKPFRRAGILRALKNKADLTQRPLMVFLEGRRAKKIKSLWLTNGMAVTVKADVIHELAVLPEVESIRLDAVLQLPDVTYDPLAAPEWNISAIRAPELWNNGFTGAGVVVANMDSGVDINHPDLKDKWRGGTNSWYDPNGEHNAPYDGDGHGTGTMGVMVGGTAGGSAIGVAPDAKWIAVKIFNDAGYAFTSGIHQGFQWLLDPDGDPNTNDAPDVVNNSWGPTGNINECVNEFQEDVSNLRAAGIAVVFSAGNSGPYVSSSASPANYPESFAVGAVDQWDGIALFSSRGPSACDGSIYPDLVAPGVLIRTSDLTFGGSFPNSYVSVSGTSFSAPHVAGAMALLFSAFPNLTVSEIESTLRQSAFDLGICGADHDYGYGLLDVMKTYQLLANPAPDISVCPPPNQFGTTREGSLSSPQMFTVTNKGISDLVIGAALVTGQNANEFILQSDGCSMQTVPPDGSCMVQVAFSPASGGAKGAYLSIPSNDPDQNPFFIPLSGMGLEQYSLTIIRAGSGSGKVTDTLVDIDCGADCSGQYAPGAVVTLKALPDVESAFGGWSGCTSGFGNTCRVPMSSDQTVTATFVGPGLTLTSPNGGEVWTAGTRKRITWSYTGNPGAYVRIELLKGGSVYSTIADQVGIGRRFRARGVRRWRISENLLPGNDYEIRITSASNGAYTDTSETPFIIAP